jgi:hypothetical protein
MYFLKYFVAIVFLFQASVYGQPTSDKLLKGFTTFQEEFDQFDKVATGIFMTQMSSLNKSLDWFNSTSSAEKKAFSITAFKNYVAEINYVETNGRAGIEILLADNGLPSENRVTFYLTLKDTNSIGRELESALGKKNKETYIIEKRIEELYIHVLTRLLGDLKVYSVI